MATTNNSAAQAGTATKKRGQFKETWRRLKKNRMAHDRTYSSGLPGPDLDFCRRAV